MSAAALSPASPTQSRSTRSHPAGSQCFGKGDMRFQQIDGERLRPAHQVCKRARRKFACPVGETRFRFYGSDAHASR